jgi:hypothetical protein
MKIILEKAGTNPDQRPSAVISGPFTSDAESLKVGDVFHVTGQPSDVKWRIAQIELTP